MNDVVVTGVGVLSPVGSSASASFASLLEGTSGVDTVSFRLPDDFDVRIAGEIRVVDSERILGVKEARRHGRVTELAAVAAREALDQAGLSTAAYDPRRIATIIGVGLGGLEALHDASLNLLNRGLSRVSPFGIPALIPNMPAGVVATMANAQGPCMSTSTACASSSHAIGEAYRLIRHGVVDAAVCGGAEACVTPLAIACFSRMRALSRRNAEPARASRPFDAERDGFVLAEGAGILILERADLARKRGAPILARILGYGASADAFHPTQPSPDGRGAVAAMQGALESAGVEPEEVQYINAHGTGTVQNDAVETLAIKRVMGSHATKVAISSTKSLTGHMLGGAGGVEAAFCVLAIRAGVVPPTANLDCPDPECDLDFVPHRARRLRISRALSNSFGFGGQNAALLFGEH